MHLQAYDHSHPADGTKRDLDEGLRLLSAAVAEARRLIAGLRPPALDELGIEDAIESLVAEARGDIPRVAFTRRLSGARLPPELETNIFRIVQEALTNVRRHAAAGSAEVTLERTATHVSVRVRDDGRGFDPAAVPEDRFGLEGLRQRCRLMGGEPRITTAPGRGTTIEVSLPIPPGD
jgi:signal transduction histidine kinase